MPAADRDPTSPKPRPSERELFEAALALPPDRRPSMVREACGDDDALERRLLRLLAAHDEAAAATGGTNAITGELLRAVDPEQVGPYRVQRRIGAGGMGIVYLAEQTAPIRRRVALKLVRAGMRTEDVVGRFLLERQALARMDHPCIARIFDSGATDDDLPYFVMEYVPGEPLNAYCDTHDLSLRARVELFVQIVRAVQHAHTKGVIHRDLKPSNVLVAEVDGEPMPKVIDFGVARAIDRDGEDELVMTQVGHLVGTPAYMSPEQFDTESVDLDTRTDIYALGVMLYELLAGSLPCAVDGRAPQRFEEVRRAVCELDPQRPSVRVAALGEHATAVAARRAESPTRLVQSLRGDLDRLVMKAIARDRALRYATAEDLARDLERYLANEPVTATPPSRLYLVRKFVARHRGLVLACSLVLLSLLLGLIGTGVGLVRAAAQRELADQRALQADGAARRAAAARDFLTGVLADASPMQSLRKDVRVADLLHEAVARLDRGEFDDDPDVHLQLRETLGTALQGVEAYDAAERQFRRALELLPLAVSADPDASPRLNLALGFVLCDRAAYRDGLDVALAVEASFAAAGTGDTPLHVRLHDLLSNARYNLAEFEAAERHALLAVEMHERIAGPNSEDGAQLRVQHAFHLVRANKLDAALQEIEPALQMLEKGSPRGRVLAAQALFQRAQVWLTRGDLEPAEEDLAAALRIRRELFADDSVAVADIWHDQGQLYIRQRRFDEAERVLQQALAVRRRLLGEHRDTCNTLMFLSSALADRDPEQALRVVDEGLQMRLRVFGPDSPAIGEAYKRMGRIQRDLGRLDESERLLRLGLENWLAALGDGGAEVAAARYDLALTLRALGRHDEAVSLLQKALASAEAVLGPISMQANQYADELVRTLLAVGRWQEAEARLRSAIAVLREARPNGTPLLFFLDAQLAAARLGLGAAAEARDLAHGAWLGLADNPNIWAKDKRFVLETLIRSHEALGDDEAAAPFRAKLAELAGRDY